MRIGLARHYQITHRKREWMNPAGFAEWIKWYDASVAEHTPQHPNPWTWDKCYSSDLRRAAFTAGKLHAGPVEFTPVLREVPFAPFFKRGPHLPLYLWETLSRLGWVLGHASQPESRKQTRIRVADFLEKLCSDCVGQNVLVVSHGFLMKCFETELSRLGYKGRVPYHPLGGRIYVFET
jgi:broad specificity phosphatase PhoE